MAEIIDAGQVVISLNGGVVACGTDASVEVTTDMRDTTCKGVSNFRRFQPSFKNVTGSASGLVEVGGANFTGLKDILKAGTKVSYVLQQVDEDGLNPVDLISGECYLTNVSLQAGAPGDNTTYSISFQGTGEFDPA